jgi:hypothetical protein
LEVNVSAAPIDLDQIKQTGIHYPATWNPVKFTCKCGAKCRIDVEVSPMSAAGDPFYEHCIEDEGRQMPGPLIAAWEERSNSWVPIERFR